MLSKWNSNAPPDALNGQVSKFVQDDEVGVTEPRCDLPGLGLMLLLFERVDEFDGAKWVLVVIGSAASISRN